MSAPVRLYATRSSKNPAVTLYNSVAKDVAAEPSGSTPRPQRSKRTQPEDDGGANSTNSSVGKSGTGRSAKRVKVERVANDNAEDEVTSPKQEVKSPRPKAPKKQKPVRQSLDTPHPTPEHWKEQYETIKSMRARLKAPVDTMGCDQAQNGEIDPKVHICRRVLHLERSTLTLGRIVDLLLWCHSCFRRKRRTKSRMRPYPNCGPPWEAASPLTASSMQRSPPSLKQSIKLASGDARQGT
jgi:endonuclease-3